MDDEYLTVPQAAALLGYHRSSVDALIKRAELPARRLNARLYILRRADVEAFTPRPRGYPPGRPRKRASGVPQPVAGRPGVPGAPAGPAD